MKCTLHAACLVGEIPEADNRWEAPSPGLCWRHCGVTAGLQPECRHIVHLVANLQSEVVQGPPQDGVRAIIEWLEGRDISVLTRRTLLVHRPGCLAASVVVPGRRLCSVRWKGVRQHLMFEKTAQEIHLKELQGNLKIGHVK